MLRAKRSVWCLGAKKILDWVKHNKTQYTQLNSIFWCFLLIWCNLIEFNLFWCKKIKIFVFCARIVLKWGWQNRYTVCILLIIHTRKHALLLVFGKGVISEFSYSLDNREDTNLTLNYISPCGRPSSIVPSPSLCLMLDELDNPN